MLSPFILGRTGNNKSVPGTGESFTAPGVLADTVFEPLMGTDSQLQRMLSEFFGTGKGTGIGLMFFIIGIAGMAVSFTRLRKPVYRELDRTETEPLHVRL